MPRTRQAIAQRVADRLFAVEHAIDVALTRAAELNASMPEASGEARLPAVIGQDAMSKAAEALISLVEARRRIVETHQSLDMARAHMGLKEVAGGGLIPKPAVFETETEGKVMPAQLRAVA